MNKFKNKSYIFEGLSVRVFDYLIHFIAYSFILPFLLFIISASGELANLITKRLIENPYLWYGSMIVFGLVFKEYLGKYLKYKQNEKDKQSAKFGHQILVDESDRKWMKDHIENVEKYSKKADHDYENYKKIELHLNDPEKYRLWKNRKIPDIEYNESQ